jgi:hypothetical protein
VNNADFEVLKIAGRVKKTHLPKIANRGEDS